MDGKFNTVTELRKAAQSYRNKEFEAVKTYCERALLNVPNQPDALSMLALVARANKKWGKAEKIVRQGIQAHPQSAFLYNTLGLIVLDQYRLDEAEVAFRQAIDVSPKHIDFKVNLGRVLHEIGRLDEAYDVLTSVLEAGRALSNTLILRSAISAERGNLTSARADLEQARPMSPNPDDFAAAEALCAFVDGDLEAAYNHFDSAVSVSANVADARVNRGVVRLLQGRIEDGWADYEMRHKRRWARTVKRPFPYPKWQGEDLEGKTLLLWGEQGLGESILCGSLISDVAAEASHIVLECDERLAPLFDQAFSNIDVRVQKTPPDPKIHSPDYQASLLDLVLYRASDAGNRKPSEAYLKPNADAVARLRSKYSDAAKGRPLVGLSWGSPKAMAARTKTISPESWVPLLSVKGVAFVNLQYGEARNAMDGLAEQAGATLINDANVDLDGPLDAPADQIAALALVISVSTSAAHLSGALGQQTWVIIPPIGPTGMWYWFTEREDSPWYPYTHLFRRQYGKDQDEDLLSTIAGELESWVKTRTKP